MNEENRLRARRTPNSVHPSTPPTIPSEVDSTYYAVDPSKVDAAIVRVENKLVTSQIVYRIGLLAHARVVFEGTRWAVYHERDVVRLLEFPEIDWEKTLVQKWDSVNSRSAAEGVCFYDHEPGLKFTQEYLETLQEDFVQFLMSREVLELYYNPVLRLYRKLDESDEHFFDRCLETLRQDYEQELRKLEETINWQEERLKEKLDRHIREHGREAVTLRPTPEEAAAAGAGGATALVGDTPEAADSGVAIDEIRTELAKLQTLKSQKIKELDEKLVMLSRQQEKDLIRVNRGQIRILRFAFIWLPYTELVIQDDDGTRRMELIRSF